MTEKDIINQAISQSTGAWFEVRGKIYAKDRAQGLVSPKMNYLQRKTQDVINRFKELELPTRIMGLKPRQKGSTTYFCACTYTKMRREPTSACLIGGQFSQTEQGIQMLQTYLANDTHQWGNTGTINEKAGTFTNGSRFRPETANDALAGVSSTIQALHCTEVARWSKYGVRNAATVLTNILKCVPLLPDTMIILESTAEGSSGVFYERWGSAIPMEQFLSGEIMPAPGQYVAVFAPWFFFDDSAMRLTDIQKDEIRHTLDADEEFSGEAELIEAYGITDEAGVQHLGEMVSDYDIWEQLAWRRWAIREECERDRRNFDQDYPHSAATAFLTSGANRFNQSALATMKRGAAKKPVEHGVIEETREGKISWRRTDRAQSKFTIWEKPIPGERYILGADPMTGESQVSGKDPDYHGVPVLRAGKWGAQGKWIKPALVARIIQCRWDIDVLEDSMWRLARMYGAASGCKFVVEINKDRGLIELLKKRGADLYVREIFNKREYKTTTAFGYETTVKTREILIDTLAKAIREHDTPGEGIDIWDTVTLTECENFVTKDNGRSEAADGHHDDSVFGLALPLQVIEHATTYWPQQGFTSLPPDLRPANDAAMPGAYS